MNPVYNHDVRRLNFRGVDNPRGFGKHCAVRKSNRSFYSCHNTTLESSRAARRAEIHAPNPVTASKPAELYLVLCGYCRGVQVKFQAFPRRLDGVGLESKERVGGVFQRRNGTSRKRVREQ